MKKIYYSLFLMLIAFGGCNQKDHIKQPDILTPEKEQIIIQELKSIVNTMVQDNNEMKVDSIFKKINKENFAGYINNGMIINNFDSTYMMYKEFFGQLKKTNFALTNESYTVLSSNSALFYADFKVYELEKNNLEFNGKGAMTFIFKKIDEKWKIIHLHLSSFPVNDTK